MFHHHIREIEKPDFQIQFVALSGFSVLELILSTHANVKSLLADMATGEVGIREVFERTLYLIQKVSTESQFSYDGSIVVYLYCLSERELSLANLASTEILNTKGLFWSRRMARAVSKYYLARQITDSIEFTSEESDPVPYTLTKHKSAEIHSRFRFSLYPEAVQVSPSLLESYPHDLDSCGIFAPMYTSFRSPSQRRGSQDDSISVQELEIAVAS